MSDYSFHALLSRASAETFARREYRGAAIVLEDAPQAGKHVNRIKQPTKHR